jgi:hypothetical protein
MRPSVLSFTLIASATLALPGCRGKLLATARLTGPGTAEVHFRGGGKTHRLWSDYDGTWTGPKHSRLPIKYDIDVIQNAKSLGKISCDTEASSGTAVCGSETTINNQHTGNCEVSLACALPALGPSEVTLKVTARIGDPSRVSRVSNMSLNVRDE